MNVFKIDPRRHLVMDTWLSRYLRRRYKQPDYFTYLHRTRGNWVVAKWATRRAPFAIESCVLPGGPWGLRNPDGGCLTSIRMAESKTSHEILKAAAADFKKVHDAGLQDEQDQVSVHVEMREFYRKRSGMKSDHPHWCMF